MSFLFPGAFVLAALAIPILLMYMLKLRRRPVEVSSIWMWQALLRDRQANTPWQRLRRSLLLILQLLILAALVLALARPALPAQSLATGSLVVVLDASASMNARDGAASGSGTTRFEAAKTTARALIRDSTGSDRITLIIAGRQPHALVSNESDKATLRRALDAAQPEQGAADWPAALALAAGAAAGGSAGDTTIILISDGGLPRQGLPPLPSPVRYLSVGRDKDNLAVTALSARLAGGTATGRVELFAGVTGYGQAEQRAILSFYSDEQLIYSQEVTLPPGKSQSVLLTDLPDKPARYTARLTSSQPGSPPLDAFPLDDAAYAVYQQPQAGRILLVTRGNIFLEQLLASLPEIQPFNLLPDSAGNFTLPQESFDAYILDGVYPSGLPASNLLLVDPPSNDLFAAGEVFTDTAGAQVTNTPLTESVQWENVHVRQAHHAALPDWAQVLVSAPGGPLVFAGQTGGRRVAALTFDLHDSDLPLQVAYPVLFSNLIHYLLQSQPVELATPAGNPPERLQPGDLLVIRPSVANVEVKATSPSGQTYNLSGGENGAVFTATNEPGIYTVQYSGALSGRTDAFAVNLFDPLESNILPAADIHLGLNTIPPARQAGQSRREVWPWLAGLALVLLVLEWWLYHRQTDMSGRLGLERLKNLISLQVKRR
ncbi:MAG TPA: VWA domain-containing protein [Anaerolineales bacterium]